MLVVAVIFVGAIPGFSLICPVVVFVVLAISLVSLVISLAKELLFLVVLSSCTRSIVKGSPTLARKVPVLLELAALTRSIGV